MPVRVEALNNTTRKWNQVDTIKPGQNVGYVDDIENTFYVICCAEDDLTSSIHKAHYIEREQEMVPYVDPNPEKILTPGASYMIRVRKNGDDTKMYLEHEYAS